VLVTDLVRYAILYYKHPTLYDESLFGSL